MPKFRVLPHGVIKDGLVEYTILDDKSNVAYSGKLTYGEWIFTETKTIGPATYLVDPSVLDPKNLSVGKHFDFGPLEATVTAIDVVGNIEAEFTVQGTDFRGTASFAGQTAPIALTHLQAEGTVRGYDVVIELLPVAGDVERFEAAKAKTSRDVYSRLVHSAMRVGEKLRPFRCLRSLWR